MRAQMSAMMTALAGLAIAGTLAACGSASSSGAASSGAASPGATSPAATPSSASPASPSSGPSSPVVAPIIFAVHLGASFSPNSLHLGVGQQFEVIVSKTVKVAGLAPANCTAQATPAAGGLLSVKCLAADSYLYTAERTGTATLGAIARPLCSPGTPCPQWISRASMKITIS